VCKAPELPGILRTELRPVHARYITITYDGRKFIQADGVKQS